MYVYVEFLKPLKHFRHSWCWKYSPCILSLFTRCWHWTYVEKSRYGVRSEVLSLRLMVLEPELWKQSACIRPQSIFEALTLLDTLVPFIVGHSLCSQFRGCNISTINHPCTLYQNDSGWELPRRSRSFWIQHFDTKQITIDTWNLQHALSSHSSFDVHQITPTMHMRGVC